MPTHSLGVGDDVFSTLDDAIARFVRANVLIAQPFDRTCTSFWRFVQPHVERERLAQIALGLRALDLPVLLVVSICAHLAEDDNALPEPTIAWTIAKRIKEFGH